MQATESTSYGNCHSTIGSYLDICYLVKLLTKKAVFYEQLERDVIRSDLPDLFTNSSASLARRVLLTEYITSSGGNWILLGLRFQGVNNENDMTAGDEDVDAEIVEKRGREMGIDYN